MVRVIIVSDIRLYREGLEQILERDGSICVVGIADNIDHALIEIHQGSPDIVLVDMTMIASCRAVTSIISACPDTKVVALAISEDEDTIFTCAQAGIAGYVSRDASIEQLITTICGVARGELYCPRKIAASLFHILQTYSITPRSGKPKKTVKNRTSKIEMLTQREREIAKLVIDGLSNKQIAHNLTIEVSTVKNHVHNILTKMGAHSRIQIVSMLGQQIVTD